MPLAIQHNRALCKVAAQPLARPAGSHNTCYVSRPRACGLVALRPVVAGVLPLSPAGGGQQNGAGDAPPLALLLRGAARVGLFVVWSLRGLWFVVLCGKPRRCLMRGKLRYPHTPGLVRSCCAPPRLFYCPRPATRPPRGAPPNQDHGERQTREVWRRLPLFATEHSAVLAASRVKLRYAAPLRALDPAATRRCWVTANSARVEGCINHKENTS